MSDEEIRGVFALVMKALTVELFDTYRQEIKALMVMAYGASFRMLPDELEKICSDRVALLETYMQDGSASLTGCFDGDELVGMVWFYERTTMDGKRIHVDQLVIRDDHRGKGIGKRLMLEVERKALVSGISSVDLVVSEMNQNALQFYEGQGFVTERRYLLKKLSTTQ